MQKLHIFVSRSLLEFHMENLFNTGKRVQHGLGATLPQLVTDVFMCIAVYQRFS